ncbi:MAG TPA: hypothetical protein PKA30_08770, partial [Accumulibacter sp.]|nr:hypothetical protein [Accumulibacter sp.]
MTASVAHLEFLVEDRSMELFLRSLLPRWLPAELTWSVHAYQGKPDLFQRLPDRLRGFANYLPDNSRRSRSFEKRHAVIAEVTSPLSNPQRSPEWS